MAQNESDYFGYGERTPEMMEAIIGRMPEYNVAILPGFRLFIQKAVELPENIQTILSASRTAHEMQELRAYVAMPDRFSYVDGLLYRGLTDTELGILDNWDINGLWFERLERKAVIISNGVRKSGRIGMADVHAQTNSADLQKAEHSKGQHNFPPALNDAERTFEIARLARREFLTEK